MDRRGGYNQRLIWCHQLQHHPSLITMNSSPTTYHSNQTLNWDSNNISLPNLFLFKHWDLCSIYRWSEGSFTINDFLIIGKICSQAHRCWIDTWIRILTHMHSSRRHWPCGDSGTMRISLPIDQRILECWEVFCRAPLNGGACICKAVSPLRGWIGELIGDITCTSNLGNLAMEVMDDFFLFFVLGNVTTEMIGDDRPYSWFWGWCPV